MSHVMIPVCDWYQSIERYIGDSEVARQPEIYNLPKVNVTAYWGLLLQLQVNVIHFNQWLTKICGILCSYT